VHKYETPSLAGAASFFLLLSSSRVVRVILYDTGLGLVRVILCDTGSGLVRVILYDTGLGLVRVMAYHSLAMIS
jgi:hypothetical protein